MNREIKVRGMSVNGWVYGYCIVMQDDFGNVTPTIYNLKTNKFIPVEEETVGRYTGLKDKTGVEIYEGDTVYDNFFQEYFEISFENRAFCPKPKQEDYLYLDEIEVIGNIYENEDMTNND